MEGALISLVPRPPPASHRFHYCTETNGTLGPGNEVKVHGERERTKLSRSSIYPFINFPSEFCRAPYQVVMRVPEGVTITIAAGIRMLELIFSLLVNLDLGEGVRAAILERAVWSAVCLGHFD